MKTPAVCVLGQQNSGKTTLITKLIRRMRSVGLRVSTIKHVSHDFQLDVKGKDSYRHLHAGAVHTIVISRKRMGYFTRLDRHVPAEELIRRFSGGHDLVLVEGYSDSRYPKIEVYRGVSGERPLFLQRRFKIDALITDVPRRFPDLRTFRSDDIASIVRFMVNRYVRPRRGKKT